ncbi:MAG TPA: preprotein translocase subunit SecY [Firmicutes bacterium]|nr:preprotein translocase subunit SecY [Bacillota bacterium]HOQ23945.1 preprotein translocase subunit SecY [Bacillota bacterium]HPT67198.1 preprotein translocase subunit SecY [Bacillota bacterium]
MLESIKTALKLPDLRKKLLWTVALLAIFRLGVHIPVPGMTPIQAGQNNIFDLLDLLGGGALRRMSIFALSVNPYITSSIIMQLLAMVIPSLEALAKEGAEGRKIISQYTRYGTVVLGIIQAAALTFSFRGNMVDASNPFNYVVVIAGMTAGSIFLMWVGEVLSERGIGNGISMLIFAGIVARLMPETIATVKSLGQGGVSFFNLLLFIAVSIVVIYGVVKVTEGERRIPVQYAKRMVGRRMYGGQSTHLPLRVNMAGVIPVIFASSVLAFPSTLAPLFKQGSFMFRVLSVFNPGHPVYLVCYAIFIFFFTYFYTAVTFNPVEVSNNLKKYGGFIPGIRPGRSTAEYLDRVLTRITLVGAFFLMCVSLLPYLLAVLTPGVRIGFGGTALLIAVGVAIDTMKQIEAHLLMRQYEGFLK